MKTVCVYCGSRVGTNPAYRAAAEQLGRELVSRNMRLVFGGGSIGMMGIVADTILAAGGEVIGVIPKFLSRKEVLHPAMTETHIVGSMHERKAMLESLADAFIALPGGLGTFEEVLEILTWSQLGLHRKNIGLLNVRGFFDPLVQQIERAIAEGFITPEHRELLVVETESAALLDRLETHQLPRLPRWLEEAHET